MRLFENVHPIMIASLSELKTAPPRPAVLPEKVQSDKEVALKLVLYSPPPKFRPAEFSSNRQFVSVALLKFVQYIPLPNGAELPEIRQSVNIGLLALQ